MWQAISQQLSDTLLFEYQITEKKFDYPAETLAKAI